MDKRSKLPQDFCMFFAPLHDVVAKRYTFINQPVVSILSQLRDATLKYMLQLGLKHLISTKILSLLCFYCFVESRMLEEGMKKPPWRPLHLIGVSTCLIGTHMFTHFPHNLQKYTGKNTENKQIYKAGFQGIFVRKWHVYFGLRATCLKLEIWNLKVMTSRS